MSAAKKQYQSLLTDHKKRKERNGRLLAKLENVEKKAAFLQAKTDRIKSLKSIYKNNANKSASPVREVFSSNGRILTERVPLNLGKNTPDYGYNPLQYSNYRYERIYNEPNPIYTLKPITLDDAIEEISRRFILVPKTQEDVLYPLPNDDLIQSNDPHPKRYDPYQKYPANKHVYEKDKKILQKDSDRLADRTPYFDYNESGGSKVTRDDGTGPSIGAGNYLSSSDDNVEGIEKNSAGSDICNEKDFEDKDDSTEKDAKGKIMTDQRYSPELKTNESNNSFPPTVTKAGDTEVKFDPQSKVSAAAKINPLVTKINETMIKERLVGNEIKTKDTPITNLLEKIIKEKEISIDRERDVEQETKDGPEKINLFQSIEVAFDGDSKPNVLDQQLIENEPNALYTSNENITEVKSENYEVKEVENGVKENIYNEDQGDGSVPETDDLKLYDGVQQNYSDENNPTEQKDEFEGEHVQKQIPLDSNQDVYPDEYNAEQYIADETQPQVEYDPNQQVYAEYSPEQYAQEQIDPNQQNYSEEHPAQEQNGGTDNPVQEAQVEYDPNQQYYDPNNVDPTIDGQNTVYPVTDQYYTESNEYVEGETIEAVTTQDQNDAYPVPDQYYSENNYTEGELNTQEFPQEGTINTEDMEQTYNGTEVKESVEMPYEDRAYAVDENVTNQEQSQHDGQEAVYPNIEASEDTNNPEQTYYDETGQTQHNQSAENNESTYEHQDNSQYYDDNTKADIQPNEEEQNATVKPLRILESDTEPEVSNRDESSKQESDFDFSIAQ